MKPRVTILMVTSLDGRLHPSRFTASPDGTRQDWYRQYEAAHASLGANAWLVGRVTMAEMSKAGPHAPPSPWTVERPLHVAKAGAAQVAVALDPSAKLHFAAGGTVGGDPVVVILGPGVADSHLAELAADGVSYFICDGAAWDLTAVLDVLARRFGVTHLVVEGGAKTNGAFLAAGVVDELRLLVAPALDGAAQIQGIAEHAEGLAGRVRLTFQAAKVLEHGVLDLTYGVLAP